jgi:hypothetical protein
MKFATRLLILALTMTVMSTIVRAQQQDLSAVQVKVTKLSDWTRRDLPSRLTVRAAHREDCRRVEAGF